MWLGREKGQLSRKQAQILLHLSPPLLAHEASYRVGDGFPKIGFITLLSQQWAAPWGHSNVGKAAVEDVQRQM